MVAPSSAIPIVMVVVWAASGGDVGLAAEPAQDKSAGSAESQPAQTDKGYPLPLEEELEREICRWVAAAAQQYELSPEQQGKLEVQLLDQWRPFMEEVRGELDPIMSELLKASFAKPPPSREAAQSWAARARPLFERIHAQIGEAGDRFAAILTHRQRLKFEPQRAKLALQLEGVGGRLRAWEKGEFEESEWHDFARFGGQPRRVEESHPASQPADEVEAELAAWDDFVESFCEHYDLDGGQRSTAGSILSEMKARARDYRAPRRERIDRLERQIAHPDPGTARKTVEKDLGELYGPIDEMFCELERRLRQIPTEAQRRRVGEQGAP